MNKLITLLAVFISTFTVLAQDPPTDLSIKSNKSPYNTWSIEANIGSNKAVRPFTEGYATSGDNKFLNITGINHFDIGVRKMLNRFFGFKFDIASDIVESQEGVTDSKPFQSTQNRIGLQGYANLGRLFNFESFTRTFGLLAHGGVQISKFTGKPNVAQKFPNSGKSFTENNGGYIIGLSPQVKITNKLVANFDFSVLINSRQHLAWDGNSSIDANNLSGEMNVLSFGLTLYMGDKKKEHADWYIPVVSKLDSDTQKKLAELELLKKDGDGDGVPDSLDLQKDTPKNVAVDSRGRFIDKNSNNIPDELEPKVETPIKETAVATNTNTEKINNPENIREIILEFGFVDIYYDVDKTLPVVRSMGVLNNLILFLKKYPTTKIAITGYADVTGNPDANIELANKRSENLKKLIVSNGIDANRINAIGKGVDQSSKANDDPSLQLGRRVSITLQ
jgi:OmpA-OmpF porin, OOP family